jgi:glycosyltransferase involved in cell wall biosynthesis
MTRPRAHVFSVAARYMAHAADACGYDTRYTEAAPDLRELSPADLVVCVDQAPDLPLELPRLPCRTVAYLIDVHQELASRLQIAGLFDAVFVAQKDYVRYFVEAGHPCVHWLPLGFDPAQHCFPSEHRIYDLGFVGKLGQRGSRRHDTLTTVLPRYRANDYSRFYNPSDMGRIYGQSRIVFNASINGDVNMRVFEAMAAGALLVTDRIGNGQDELFRENEHFVGYSDVAEAIEKIDHYLAHEDDRRRVAEAGRALALERHSYHHRWREIEQLSAGAMGLAPARRYTNRQLSGLYSGVFVSLRMPSRIPHVIRTYGASPAAMRNLARSAGRWVNSRIPLTPNAIRARLRS